MALQKANADFVCKTAKNGKEALENAAKHDFVPNYIFVDLNMPMVSGRECVVALRKIDRLAHVPIIVYTTSSFGKDIEDVKALGATHYLIKPSSFTALVAALEKIFATETILPFLID